MLTGTVGDKCPHPPHPPYIPAFGHSNSTTGKEVKQNMDNKYKTAMIRELYVTLVRAHLALLDEILDSATSEAARRCATIASEQICSTVYHMIHDTGVEYIHDRHEVLVVEATLRAMERAVFPDTMGARFGLYPDN